MVGGAVQILNAVLLTTTKSNIIKGLKFAEIYGIFVAYAKFVGDMFVYSLPKLWVMHKATWPESMDLAVSIPRGVVLHQPAS